MQPDIISFDLRQLPFFYVCGTFEATSPWHHKHMYQPGNWEIIFLIKGTIYCRLEETPYTIHAGEYFLVPPFTNFYGTKAFPIGTQYLWFHFFPQGNVTINDPQADKSYTTASIPRQASFLHINHVLTMAYQILDLNKLFKGYILDISISELLFLVAQDYCDHLHHKNFPQSERSVNSVKSWINAHLNEIETSKQIADEFNFNVIYLNRLFKHYFHQSLYQYVIGQKIERAKQLLISTDAPVYDIAGEAYFNDPKNFTRTFKKRTGITPSRYRKTFSRKNIRTPSYDPVMPVSDRIMDQLLKTGHHPSKTP